MTGVWDENRSAIPLARCASSIQLYTWIFLAWAALLSWPDAGQAQSGGRFGEQARADAASQAIVLAVQQGISALPPTSSQALVYEFNREFDEPVRTRQLGPTSFRTPETIEEGHFTVRAAASYFELPATLGPIDYRLTFDNPIVSVPEFVKFGTQMNAKVGVFDFTMNYGITARIEANLNLPIVVVDAQASQIYSADPINPGALGFRPSIHDLNAAIAQHKILIHYVPFSKSGLDFNDGTHVGMGRISLGTKALLYAHGPFRLAGACDFYVPSPNQSEFAGSDSASILPRLIGAARLAAWMRLHLDAGYDYDFDVSQLRRFVWNTGISFPLTVGTFDVGVGGSKYDTPIVWTPTNGRASVIPGTPSDISVTAVGDNQTGTNAVDFLAGVKVHLTKTVIVSGAVNVPVTNDALQPIVGGTLAVELAF